MKKLLFIILILFSISFISAQDICQYATSASATSQSQGSEPEFATGEPNADYASCDFWSGKGYSWSPENWNMKSNITLNYDEFVYARDVEIVGDYDPCWRSIWVKNSETNEIRKIHERPTSECNFKSEIFGNFYADSVIIETCGWSWSSIDSVKLCGSTLEDNSEYRINEEIYVVPYIGDFDGGVNPSRFELYRNLMNFFRDNNLPGGFSFYPKTLENSQEFTEIISEIYAEENIELIQKGNSGDSNEQNNNLLSLEEQREVARLGQEIFKSKMQEQGISEVKTPTAYNLIQGKFTSVTIEATKELGFVQYFDVYFPEDVGPTSSVNDFDVIQYGVSFTTQGDTGPDTEFKTIEQIYQELDGYERSDVTVKRFNDIKIIPLWVHQQDFIFEDGSINSDKWEIYTETLKRLNQNPNVTLITPEESYYLNHEGDNGGDEENEYCQYAVSASATSESLGSKAIYAIGKPRASIIGCSFGQWSGFGISWSPLFWNMKANLTLDYETPVYVENLTIFGDYDICWRSMWLENSRTGEKKQIENGFINACIFEKQLDETFLADRIIVETCGWSWSSTDAVRICGKPTSKEITNNKIEVCDWKDCQEGAVSISVDDFYTSCISDLNANGYKGTYALSNTDEYTPEMWQEFNNIFKNGHEIATHTRYHWCIENPIDYYVEDIEGNIQDITSNTDVTREDIVTHVHPCGYVNDGYKKALEENWNYIDARGYYFESLEDKTPLEALNLKSYSTLYGHDTAAQYRALIDKAQEENKWANLVFHHECAGIGVIDYLTSKNLWVDTIGNVMRYISLRDNAKITKYSVVDDTIYFNINVDPKYDDSHHNQDLTLKVPIAKRYVDEVLVNGNHVEYRILQTAEENYIIFNVEFPIQKEVRISLR